MPHEHAMANGVPDAARPHVAGRLLPSAPQPRHPFSDHKVVSRGSQMTRRAFGMPWAGVPTPPAGKPPGLGPSGGMKNIPASPLMRLTFVFQPCKDFLHNSHSKALTNGNLTATSRKIKKRPYPISRVRPCFIWWALSDSNRGPRDYESPALTD